MQKLSTGEGDQSETSEKLNACDFALWKASKPGEPFWNSLWGQGRPGWHIECSAMASDIFGPTLDIHSGGVDLKFPHHDNEIAQSEAYHKNNSWVAYFLHSGHLTISGCKMSKSLKNFITIQEALKRNSARQLRIVFLKHSWREVLDYSPDTMTEAVNFEKSLYDFTFNASYLTQLINAKSLDIKMHTFDQTKCANYLSLTKMLRNTIHTQLSDNFETRGVMMSIHQYISDMNAILSKNPVDSTSGHLVETAKSFALGAKLIIQTMAMFGAADVSDFTEPGLSIDSLDVDEKLTIQLPWISLDKITRELFDLIILGIERSAKEFTSMIDTFKDENILGIIKSYQEKLNGSIKKKPTDVEKESEMWPILYENLRNIADYRQEIRGLAQGTTLTDKSTKIALLKACDVLRDDLLPSHHIRLQDKSLTASNDPDLPAIGYMPKWILLEGKREKDSVDAKKREEKLNKEKLQNELAKINPKEMFLGETDKYSKFDKNGLPTHDEKGEELTKSKLKKLVKLQEAQDKKYSAWLQKNQS